MILMMYFFVCNHSILNWIESLCFLLHMIQTSSTPYNPTSIPDTPDQPQANHNSSNHSNSSKSSSSSGSSDKQQALAPHPQMRGEKSNGNSNNNGLNKKDKKETRPKVTSKHQNHSPVEDRRQQKQNKSSNSRSPGLFWESPDSGMASTSFCEPLENTSETAQVSRRDHRQKSNGSHRIPQDSSQESCSSFLSSPVASSSVKNGQMSGGVSVSGATSAQQKVSPHVPLGVEMRLIMIFRPSYNNCCEST